MNSNQAENRELTLAISINPKKPTKRGCYLALTFGTLLSSQGTDAQQLDPLGLRHWRLSMVRRAVHRFHPGGFYRLALRPARRREDCTPSRRPVQGPRRR